MFGDGRARANDRPAAGVHPRDVFSRTVLVDPNEVAPADYVSNARDQIAREGLATGQHPRSIVDRVQEDSSRWVAVTFDVWYRTAPVTVARVLGATSTGVPG